MSSLVRILIAAVPVLVLAGCASTPVPVRVAHHGQVNYQVVEDENASRYKLGGMQTVGLPVTGPENMAPVYPPELVPLALDPVTVLSKVIVNDKGNVTDVRFPIGSPDTTLARFQSAVRQAVLAWTFQPMRIRQWVENPDGSQEVVGEKTVPYSQDYQFTFSVRDGKPVVGTGIAPRADGNPEDNP